MMARKPKWFTFETAITLAIAACMIFLINFANAKMEEITISNKESLLINHDPTNPIHEGSIHMISYLPLNIIIPRLRVLRC